MDTPEKENNSNEEKIEVLKEERKNIKVKNRKDKNNSLSEQNISAVS